jgi:hypothetical protein
MEVSSGQVVRVVGDTKLQASYGMSSNEITYKDHSHAYKEQDYSVTITLTPWSSLRLACMKSRAAKRENVLMIR